MKQESTSSSITYRTALICATGLLTCIGLLSIYASSSIPAHQSGNSEYVYLNKQLVAALAGFGLIFFIGHINFKWIERATLPVFIGCLLLLCAVHLPGFEGRAKGASRWIVLHGFTIQPGEFIKLGLVLFLAKSLSRYSSNMGSFKQGILPNLLAYALVAGLLMVQPDFGTAALLFVITFFMLFAAGLSSRYVVGLGITSLLALGAAIIAAPYRFSRLMTFLDPWTEIRTGGFQIIQSYLGFKTAGCLALASENHARSFIFCQKHILILSCRLLVKSSALWECCSSAAYLPI